VNDEGALYDSGFDDAGPFTVTPEPGGVSLESALADFGPAAIDDLIPRLRGLAADLDAAHARGLVHGRLHPHNVSVHPDATCLLGRPVAPGSPDVLRWPVQPPYTAPEVTAGGTGTPAADQFALAAIAYEWMFGRPIAGPAERSVDVRALPGVDRGALSNAFTRALAPEPARRFASCGAFVDALSASVVPSLPLVAADDHADADVLIADFAPEPDLTLAPEAASPGPMVLDAGHQASGHQAIEPQVRRGGSSDPPAQDPQGARFSGAALIAAALVGMVFGFAGGYMARPRALQQVEMQVPNEQPPMAPAQPSGPVELVEPEIRPAPAPRPAPPPRPSTAPAAPVALPPPPLANGELVVESIPRGAAVTVNGRPSGKTPLTLADLAPGEYRVTITMLGYREFATTVRVVAGERARAAARLTEQEQE